jgi:glycerol uptake facilitator-like aquaporin
MWRVVQQLVAELVGTWVVVLVAAGAAVVDPWLRAAGQPVLGTLGGAVCYGGAIAAMIEVFAPVSGGHLNPAVTLGAWVARRIGTARFVAYVVVQLAGGIAAAWFLRVVVPESAWRAAGLGSPVLASSVTRSQGMGLEAVLTFAVAVVFFGTAAAAGKPSGWAVGAMVAAGAMVASPLTGAAFNPARALGPALVIHHWANQGVWWIGPLVGGVLAGWFAGVFGGRSSREA